MQASETCRGWRVEFVHSVMTREKENVSETKSSIRSLFNPAEGPWDDIVGRHLEYLEFYPKSAVAFYNLGFAFAQRDQVGNAEVAFNKALELNPDMVEAQVNLGGLAFGKGDWNECIRYNNLVLVKKPGFPQARTNIAYAMFMMGENEAAEKEFLALEKERPKDGSVQYGLAVLYDSLDNRELSRKYFERAVQLGYPVTKEFAAKFK